LLAQCPPERLCLGVRHLAQRVPAQLQLHTVLQPRGVLCQAIDRACAAAAGELVGFGWSTSKPFLHYFVLDAGGGVKLDVPVDVGQSTFMHDFAITKVWARARLRRCAVAPCRANSPAGGGVCDVSISVRLCNPVDGDAVWRWLCCVLLATGKGRGSCRNLPRPDWDLLRDKNTVLAGGAPRPDRGLLRGPSCRTTQSSWTCR